MQILRFLLALLLGVGLGWFLRGLVASEAPARSDRPAPAAPARFPPLEAVEPAAPAPAPAPVEAPAPVAAPPEPVPAETTAGGDPLAEMVRTQRPQWKAWAGMQAKQKLEGLFAKLGFDEATQKRIEQALLEDADRQVDRAIAMMLGEEEIDPAAFAYFLGLPPDLTPEVERDLGAFLSDRQIQGVRAEVKRAHQKQREDLADMQIGLMAIPDLTDDQRTRARQVFAGRDVMTEQFTQFAELTRDRTKLERLFEGEGLREQMQEGFAPTRRRMRDILTPQQFTRYEAYEEAMIKQAEMGVKMMSSMLKAQRAERKPDGR